MDNIRETATEMAKQLSEMIRKTERYEEYLEAKKALHADRNMYKKMRDFVEKHTAFLYAMRDGTATFEQERYLSQEFHKLMLNHNVNVYMTTTLEFVDMLAAVFKASVEDIDIELDF